MNALSRPPPGKGLPKGGHWSLSTMNITANFPQSGRLSLLEKIYQNKQENRGTNSHDNKTAGESGKLML
jgi:hypothetical protein